MNPKNSILHPATMARRTENCSAHQLPIRSQLLKWYQFPCRKGVWGRDTWLLPVQRYLLATVCVGHTHQMSGMECVPNRNAICTTAHEPLTWPTFKPTEFRSKHLSQTSWIQSLCSTSSTIWRLLMNTHWLRTTESLGLMPTNLCQCLHLNATPQCSWD